MGTIYITDRASRLLFEYGKFTDAEVGKLVRIASNFEENHGYPSLSDRAMDIACRVIYEDQFICRLNILKAEHGNKIL